MIRECAYCPSLYVHGEGNPRKHCGITVQPGRSYCTYQEPAFLIDRRRKGIPECCGRKTATPIYRVYVEKEYIALDTDYYNFPARYWRIYTGPLWEAPEEQPSKRGHKAPRYPLIRDGSLYAPNGRPFIPLGEGDMIHRTGGFEDITTFEYEHGRLIQAWYGFKDDDIEDIKSTDGKYANVEMVKARPGYIWVWMDSTGYRPGTPAIIGHEHYERAAPKLWYEGGLVKMEPRPDISRLAVSIAIIAGDLWRAKKIQPPNREVLSEAVFMLAQEFYNGYIADARKDERLEKFTYTRLYQKHPPLDDLD